MKLRKKLVSIDIIRSIMILWIFITHYYESFFEGAAFGNPRQNWPSLGERFSQLLPISFERFSISGNIFRYIALLGDQGVQVFILISGFVLTYSFLDSGKKKNRLIFPFYKKRILRIYPAWVLCHIGLMLTFVLLRQGINPFSLTGMVESFWSSDSTFSL